MAKSELIKELARGKIDTEIALKQLKLLLDVFPNANIMSWVDKELTGYKQGDELPSYRKAGGSLTGTFLNHLTHATNVGIPLRPDAPKELSGFCNFVEFKESVGALKSLMESDNKGIVVNVPPDWYPLIIKYSAMSMTAILSARVNISSAAIPHIFSEIDNKVLDILMLLEKEFGNLDELDIDLSSKSEQEVTDIQKRIIVYIYNDNSISIGNDNQIEASVIASKSNIDE